MEYIIQLISVTITDRWDSKTAKAMALVVMAKVNETGLRKVLVDMPSPRGRGTNRHAD